MAKAKKAEKEAKVKKEKKPKASSRAVALDAMEGKLAAVGFDISSLMDDALDLIEKKTKVSSQDAARHAHRVSTGQLALDMYLDGGIVPGGWYTFFGGEQSCKSTTTMSIMASLVKLMYTGIAVVFDYEGSTDAEYVAGQLKTFGVTVDPKTIFGVRDDKTGGWLIKPKIRYYAPDNGGRFFDYMSMLRRRLPDKVVEKDGSAWLFFENTKENRAKVEGEYDKKYFSAHNQFKVPATDGHMQAVVLVDSYPAMLPDMLDDDDGSNAMAIQARMFSDGIKRFRGGMRRKMMTIVGVNQVRQRPATMFGNPEYEPCGDALKFYCFASDTPIKTDCGVLTAPQIKEILDSNGTVCVETLNGYQPIASAWPVEDAPYPIELDALGHGYVGSAKHRQLVFCQDLTHDGQIVMRTEWKTLEELTKFHGDRFAAVRFGAVEELKQNTPDAYDDSQESALTLIDVLGVKTVELSFGIDRMGNTMAEQYAMIDTSEIADTTQVIEHFAQIGIIAIKQDSVVVLPGIESDKLRDIVAEGITVEQSSLQRHTMMMLACDQFPELAKFCMEYNMLTTFGNTETTGALLIDNEDIKTRIDRLLDADFELSAHYAEDYDLLHQQLAYVEDFYMFDGQIVPVPFTLNVVTDRKIDFWDVNVPETGVIITNGLVSHNSDVRIKLTSRAVPDGWPKMKDSPAIVGEKSVTVEGGTDRYRFIAAKTIKNKMGGIPNQQTWMRLWEADGNGEARGFDPVFDCWHYLKTLGLINGPRKGFKIKSPCPLASDVKMDWDDFRTLINGTKPQIKAVCDKLKVKPAGLRLWCFKFVQSEKGRDMLKASISKSAKATVEDDE